MKLVVFFLDGLDGEDLTRAAILGNINALFFVGDVIQVLGDVYYGKPWAKDITNLPLLEQFNALLDKLSRFISSKCVESDLLPRLGNRVTSILRSGPSR